LEGNGNCEIGEMKERVGRDKPPIGIFEEVYDGFELFLDDFGGLVGFALLEGFANAEDDAEGDVEGRASFLGDYSGGLVEEGSALGVAFVREVEVEEE
jgi:hypothetical protein